MSESHQSCLVDQAFTFLGGLHTHTHAHIRTHLGGNLCQRPNGGRRVRYVYTTLARTAQHIGQVAHAESGVLQGRG